MVDNSWMQEKLSCKKKKKKIERADVFHMCSPRTVRNWRQFMVISSAWPQPEVIWICIPRQFHTHEGKNLVAELSRSGSKSGRMFLRLQLYADGV